MYRRFYFEQLKIKIKIQNKKNVEIKEHYFRPLGNTAPLETVKQSKSKQTTSKYNLKNFCNLFGK